MNGYAFENYNTRYDFFTNNCSDLAVDVLRAGGISVNGDVTTLGITTPYKVWNLLIYRHNHNNYLTIRP